MQLTDNELRSLIADGCMKLASWAHDPSVATPKVIKETLDRMRECADALAEVDAARS